MTYDEALAFLDAHVNLEADPAPRAAAMRLDGIRHVCSLMGDPQRAYPVVHLTGTNGKGSTARMITELLAARGLSVGTYTSPHLERVNERLTWNGEPISDDDFAEVVGAISHYEMRFSSHLSHFEVLTAAAFRWFADNAVDVAVVEVGLGGRYDATNVADAAVAVVTNVDLDHTAVIGPTRHDIALEKSGIVKPGSRLVVGETDPDLVQVFAEAGAESVWLRGDDFECVENRPAHGGRVLDLRTPGATYPDVYLPVHGSYQGDNAAVALAAAEAFFGEPLHEEVVGQAFADVRVPGRMEVVGRHPVRILDGAHNPAGAEAAAATLQSEFGGLASRVMVVGMLAGRDPVRMLEPYLPVRLVVACPPPSPRAMPAPEVAAAAESLGIDAVVEPSVEAAVRRAQVEAGEDELLLVTGSLYVVGSARTLLKG
ncbi:MAG: Mur ligase family protein [Actinomycetota bacterium]|nr:Mur ligase family protein [Actinomycetota bacterium]